MSQELGQKKILIIEPDDYYHAQFQNHLADIAELTVVKRAAAALAALQDTASRPDIVVMELLLEDGHAYDLMPKFRGIPIVIYTKISHLPDVQASLNLGAIAYFVKGQDTLNDIRRFVLAHNS